MLLPPPLVIPLDGAPPSAWTSYVSPAAIWSTMPVHVSFGSTPPKGLLDADAVAMLDAATRVWMLPACTSARFAIDASHLGGTLAANGQNEIIVHDADWPAPLASGAGGHTVIFTLGDRVVEADIHLNARDYVFAIGKVDKTIDLRAILTHELGHVIGIGHSADTRATMAAGLPSGLAARSLEEDDRTAVCTLYPTSATITDARCPALPCPSGTKCVGFACERADEISTLGAACEPASEPRRCDATGDRASCIDTSIGARCTIACTMGDAGDPCGAALQCKTIAPGEAWCLPIDATAPDAGVVDAPSSEAGDAGARPSPPNEPRGCGCTTATRTTRWPFPFAIAVVLAMVRRRARPPLRRSTQRP